MIVIFFMSCTDKNIFSVRLPKNQRDYITKEKISYSRGVQLRYSNNKTIFFASMENMLSYIEKYDWNILRADVKKAYVLDYEKSKDKKTELWINISVAFFSYIKDENGNKILVAWSNPKTIDKYKNKIMLNDWKYTKSINKYYFTLIELIRELRAEKKENK
jgi:hypothetical protein